MCEIDWGVISNLIVAAATVFTGVIAWVIFKGWRDQKRSEVLANEAKQLISDIFEIDRIISRIINIEMSSFEELKVNLDNFSLLKHVINTRIDFLKSELNDSKALEKLIIKMNDVFKKLKSQCVDSDRTEYRDNDGLFKFNFTIAIQLSGDKRDLMGFKKSIEDALEACKDKALYRS